MTLLVYFHYRRRAEPFAPGYKIDKMRAVSGNEVADFVEETRKYAREHGKNGLSMSTASLNRQPPALLASLVLT